RGRLAAVDWAEAGDAMIGMGDCAGSGLGWRVGGPGDAADEPSVGAETDGSTPEGEPGLLAASVPGPALVARLLACGASGAGTELAVSDVPAESVGLCAIRSGVESFAAPEAVASGALPRIEAGE